MRNKEKKNISNSNNSIMKNYSLKMIILKKK